MGEYKRGELHSGSSTGPQVRSRPQAVAIALAEQKKAAAGGYAAGGEVPGHWIKGAIKHPGAERRAAAAAGMSTHAYMEAHKGDSGTAGRRARLGLTLSRMADGGLVVGGMRRGQFAPVPQEDLQNADMRKAPIKEGDAMHRVVQGDIRRNTTPSVSSSEVSVPRMAGGGIVRMTKRMITRPVDEPRERLEAARRVTEQKRDSHFGGDAGEERYDAIRESNEREIRKATGGERGSPMPVGGREEYRDGGMVQHREPLGQYAHGGVVHNLKTPSGPNTLSEAARQRFARNSKGH